MIFRAFVFSICCVVLYPISGLCFQIETKILNEGKDRVERNEATVSIDQVHKQVDVTLDGELFTTFDFDKYSKPIFYPIFGPGQISMTRNWPMKENTTGESKDHPHHKSMWISHEISGVDFWSEKGGSVKTETIETNFVGNPSNVFRAKSKWIKKSDGKSLLTDQTTYWFGGDQSSRWINCLIKYNASHGDFEFDDTKEGLFAIRTHPDLRLTAKPKSGVKEVFGKAVNSEGVTGKSIWGKPAKWLLYYGEIDGRPVSIAMYDHPANLRHPTTWHARDYGLVTANPFGLHHFLGKAKGSGTFKVESGKSLELRYGIEFFQGIATTELVEEKYQTFAKNPLSSLTANRP